jgi:hypothetical protein
MSFYRIRERQGYLGHLDLLGSHIRSVQLTVETVWKRDGMTWRRKEFR